MFPRIIQFPRLVSQRRILLRAAGAAWFLIATSSCHPSRPEEPFPEPVLNGVPVACRVDAQRILREIPSGLFGTNLEWFNQANGLAHDDGSVSESWLQLARQEGITTVRFPGGTLSDFYHWEDGTGPTSERPVREHPTDTGKSGNAFGTPEFLRFCSAINARPLITVNAGTGTADEAARWVAYCNNKSDTRRVQDGLPADLRADLWEIGNELYLPGNPTDKKVITVSSDVYARRFREFAQAMRRVDPTIKLIGIGMANSTTYHLPNEGWTETLLQQAAGEMDYIAVHNAYFPYLFGQKDLNVREVYQALWAAPEAVQRSLSELDKLIGRYEKERKIGIAITEWGALYSFDRYWIDHVKTQGTAVYLARLMQVFMSQPRVQLANYFKFTDRTFMGWVGYDQRPKIPYYVIELFTHHFGNRLVASEVDSPTYQAKAIAFMHEESNVPEVTAIASLDASGRHLFVNLINRSWNTIHQVSLTTAHFDANPTATAWELSSPGVTDHNGRDLPEEWPAKFYSEPRRHPRATPVVALQKRVLDLTKPVILQPFSIVTLELDARP